AARRRELRRPRSGRTAQGTVVAAQRSPFAELAHLALSRGRYRELPHPHLEAAFRPRKADARGIGAHGGRQDGEESEEGSGQLPHAVTYTREPWRQASRKLRCCHEVGSMADVRSLPPPDPSVTASREDGEAPGAPRDGMRLASRSRFPK